MLVLLFRDPAAGNVYASAAHHENRRRPDPDLRPLQNRRDSDQHGTRREPAAQPPTPRIHRVRQPVAIRPPGDTQAVLRHLSVAYPVAWATPIVDVVHTQDLPASSSAGETLVEATRTLRPPPARWPTASARPVLAYRRRPHAAVPREPVPAALIATAWTRPGVSPGAVCPLPPPHAGTASGRPASERGGVARRPGCRLAAHPRGVGATPTFLITFATHKVINPKEPHAAPSRAYRVRGL